MAQLAVYEAKLGHRRDARRYIDAAISINPESAEVLYRRAVVHALGGQTADAMSALSRAISSGYSKAFAAEDDDLTALKAVPEFRKLMESPSRPAS
jgi:hypothetical protein